MTSKLVDGKFPDYAKVIPKDANRAIVGDRETIPWPLYTSRLDIEPELAVVYGNPKQPVAGFCIFNDVSARDVQVPEVINGFCLTKDMAAGNQLGPNYLKAYSNGREAKAGIDAYFRFYNTQRPHQALSYRTPAEVFYGNEMQSTERATERRWSLSRSLESYTGAVGPSINLAPILSN